jgi:hypothetical protein
MENYGNEGGGNMANKNTVVKTKVVKAHARAIAPGVSTATDFLKHSKPYVTLMIVLIIVSSFIGLPVKDLPGCLLSLVISIINVYVGYRAITRYMKLQIIH